MGTALRTASPGESRALDWVGRSGEGGEVGAVGEYGVVGCRGVSSIITVELGADGGNVRRERADLE